MKPRQASPQPELLRMRTFRLETANEAPKIQINEVFSPGMGLNGFSNFLTDPDTPTKQTSSESILSPPHSQASSPPAMSPNESNSSPWSSAVGGAKNGKSGRVIERLMGENDRLQREKTLACAKYEEELKRSESARSALDSLQASNQNLLSMHETDKTLLTKKERKIEELRAELEFEKSKREQAENETRETRKERDAVVQKLMKETMEEREQSKRSICQYEILSKSWKGQEERYDRQTQKLKMTVKDLQDELTEEKRKLAELDLTTEQLQQESEKMSKIQESLVQTFETYKHEQQQGVKGIRETAERNEIQHEQLLREVAAVVGEMKYVVNVKQSVREAECE